MRLYYCSVLTFFVIHLVFGHDQEVNLLMKGKKNHTGHLITEVYFSEEPVKTRDNWKFDLKHGVSTTGGRKKFYLKGAITVPPSVPVDYHLFPGIGYYKFHWNVSIGFFGALSTCRDEGGHLIILNSEEEAGVVRNLFSTHQSVDLKAFAGFYDPTEGHDFVTIFGLPLNETGYVKWGRHQPNARENESCGYVYVDGTIGDVVCSSPLPFICEYDLSWS